jgi:hypothetical protein
MKNRPTKRILLIAAGLLACAGQASAVNITIPDFNGPTPSSGGLVKPSAGFGGGVSGQAGEDNEVEYSAVRNQYWDLEAFAIKGGKLYLIGGYDFENGYVGGPGLPGDLFIKVGGSMPGPAPTVQPTTPGGRVQNGLPNIASGYTTPYNFTYAVNLAGNLAGGSIGVKTLSATTELRTVQYDTLGSNPWNVYGSYAGDATTAVSYYQNLNAAAVATLTGVAGLTGDTDGTMPGVGVQVGGHTPNNYYNGHNVVAIDLSFLSNVQNGAIHFSYTMQCGNDSIKGLYYVPDGGTTLVLLGTALSGLCLVGRRFRK